VNDVKAKTEKSDKKRAGYCECCEVRFDDFTLVSDIASLYHALVNLYFHSLNQHVKGDQHMAYATNPSNFASLDALYDLYNIPTLDQFVAAQEKM